MKFDTLQLPPGLPVVVLMRHAARPPIPEGEVGGELSITPEGEAKALALGQRFRQVLVSVRSSPVRRCVETARAIVRGAERDIDLVSDPMLGAPGAFIADPELAWENWLRVGHDGVLDHLASGAAPLPGFAEPIAASRALIDHLLGVAAGPGLHLAITHDALMIPLLAARLKRPVAAHERPDFLDGITLSSRS